ncbi:MAG: glycoside hydrolase family 3 C-terminal domain-containing protein [Verrucomicrobia bacterium]|nr:glycoside hydrolase family 3 C-terminal domain-containing protein [Verrucomicrobiota bacterium]
MAAISIGIAWVSPLVNAAADDAGTRARRLASAMTLEEKLDYLGGMNSMSIRPVPRLGIPEIRMSDGPVGVRQSKPSTRYPAGVALAATWQPELARAEGVAMGRDCRARGIHILLAPAVNIHRVPVNGRNFEYMSGEDPYLAARMAVPFVEGVQSQGVVATVKHFAANNQEYERRSIDARVDERTLREIYLPAFAAAVTEGGAGAVMDAYNRLNGAFCTENAWLNEQVLRKEWGFPGLLMSDWEATHSTVGAFQGKLDLEMPSGQNFSVARLSEALAAHQISAEQVDEKVVHILTPLIRMGFLDRPQQDAAIPERDPASEQTALAIAREGIVLLKNQEKLLPLDRTKVHSLAVLGPRAYPGVATGGGSSYVNPTHAVSVLEGLRQALGPNVKVDLVPAFVPSYLVTNFYHVNQAGELVPGLHGEYFDNDGFAGQPKMFRDDEHIDFVWSETGPFFEPLDAGQFSIRWTGYLIPEASGPHLLRTRADDAIRVYLDGKLVIDDWRDHDPRVTDVTRYLKAGKPYALRIEYRNRAGGAVAQFAFAPLQVPETLRNYDAAVVCVGFDDTTEGEGSDRLFQLPPGQDDLVEQVEALNPKTVVVLFGGGGADVSHWIDHTPAFLHAWYPGQEGGTAIAEILTGAVGPSGKLPVTFDRHLEDNPVMANYPSQDGGRTVRYDEGVFVGYRAASRRTQPPLYPFGYGLTYTHFDFRNLTITRDQPGDGWRVTFELSNDGDRPGSEVPQLYVAFPKSPVPRPEQELKRFIKVFLQPGQTRTVTLSLPEQVLGYYDVTNHRWNVVPGEYEFRVGASSQDLPLRGKATVPDNQNDHGPAANGT